MQSVSHVYVTVDRLCWVLLARWSVLRMLAHCIDDASTLALFFNLLCVYVHVQVYLCGFCVGRYADVCRDLYPWSHVCGGQKAALAAPPQVLSALFLFFGTGSHWPWSHHVG